MTFFPNLRFPGFEGDEKSYNKNYFENLFTFSTGKNIKQNEASTEFTIPCIRYGELYYMYNEVIIEIINKTNLDKSELLLSDGDEILLPSAGEDPLDIGSASALLIENVAIGRTINILKPLISNVYSQIYVSFYINHRLRKKISTLAKGSSISNVYNSDLKTLSITLPTLDEQNKVASFLASIDNRIQTQKKIISQSISQMSNLKDLIFERKLRFKNDNENEFPDWIKSKLEDICEKQSSSISANKIQDNIGDYPIYGATGILKNIDFYEVENDYISIIKDGAGVGRLLYCKGKSSVLGTLDIIKSKNLNLYFIFLLLSRIDFKKYVTGSTIPHIYFKDYKKEKVQIPSLKEQEKIANFFKSLDDKINIENSLLLRYENQKKYLLQNLFV